MKGRHTQGLNTSISNRLFLQGEPYIYRVNGSTDSSYEVNPIFIESVALPSLPSSLQFPRLQLVKSGFSLEGGPFSLSFPLSTKNANVHHIGYPVQLLPSP